uniref:UPF0235 protein C15orf40 homolog n=1 Tax=Heterorhabditis bacteriophora TaxID=37862 RepID=A0A1I7XPU5_HETBA
MKESTFERFWALVPLTVPAVLAAFPMADDIAGLFNNFLSITTSTCKTQLTELFHHYYMNTSCSIIVAKVDVVMLRKLLKRPAISSAMGKAAKTAGTKAEKETESAISVNKNGQIVLRIHAKPGARLNAITDVSESEVGVAIAAPPREGQANEELLHFIGRILGLRKNEVDFDKGAKSRSKVLLISSNRISVEQVMTKLKSVANSKDVDLNSFSTCDSCYDLSIQHLKDLFVIKERIDVSIKSSSVDYFPSG